MKKFLSLILSICLVVMVTGCNVQQQVKNEDQEIKEAIDKIEKELENVADEVFTGKIVTMDDKGTVAEAIAVKNGDIMFVSSVDEVKKYIGATTIIHDYEDNFVYPGFIDGHNHMGLVATMLIDGAILSATDTLRQNAETMKEYIEAHPGKEVYKGLGFWILG